MEASELSVRPSPVHRLDIARPFATLDKRERLYAHHLSRAAWMGARIIMNQVSPESEEIFELIMDLYAACAGDWPAFLHRCQISISELEMFLEYAATFLSNVGNYYGSGDQKFMPALSQAHFAELTSVSEQTKHRFDKIASRMYSQSPSSLGFASEDSQSAYYLGAPASQDEIKMVSQALEKEGLHADNTRIRKNSSLSGIDYDVLQASTNERHSRNLSSRPETLERGIRLVGGDHARDLKNICRELQLAIPHATGNLQQAVLYRYIESFETGDLESYRQSQRLWVSDKSPHVENIFGFVEPYRDPFGVRAEWEGLVAISDKSEGQRLQALVSASSGFIRKLPWVDDSLPIHEKGPFEKSLFESPDFTSIHALAYCSSIIFPGINLPNYNDIREKSGFKNVIIANRMSLEGNLATLSPFVAPHEAQTFQKHKFIAYYIWVVLHELLGHGTGQMLSETSPGIPNFNVDHPPINPLTSEPIKTWYRYGETWTGQFQDLATTVDECRAELVGAYLMDDPDLLKIFGVPEEDGPSAADVTFNLYLQLGVDGLRGLQNYNMQTGKWGQAHSQAHFATLKWLLEDGGGFMKVHADPVKKSIHVSVDRSRMISHGKPAVGRMLLRLHMYRCTADVAACREYYGNLSRADEEHLEWRRLVVAQAEPKWKYVQGNTFLEGDEVVLKEYEASNRGIIQSWAERRC